MQCTWIVTWPRFYFHKELFTNNMRDRSQMVLTKERVDWPHIIRTLSHCYDQMASRVALPIPNLIIFRLVFVIRFILGTSPLFLNHIWSKHLSLGGHFCLTHATLLCPHCHFTLMSFMLCPRKQKKYVEPLK